MASSGNSGLRGWFKRLLGRGGPLIPVVRLRGTISSDPRPGHLNIEAVGPLLQKAFDVKQAPAIAIVVNSPGGSAVQSRLIAKRIRDLADENDKKVLVFVEDVAASGGYFIATGGDEIIADPSSFVGSIGVIIATFGLVDAMSKLGVERRLYTAGKNKAMLDPFQPEKKADVDRVKRIGTEIHQVFIDWVKARRAGKLVGSDDVLFTGEFWTAGRGVELGLIDALGDIHSVLRERFGEDARTRVIAPKRGLLNLPRFGLSSGGGLFGHDAAGDLIAAIEDRALWSRFGL